MTLVFCKKILYKFFKKMKIKTITSNLLERIDLYHGFITNEKLENDFKMNFEKNGTENTIKSYEYLQSHLDDSEIFAMNQVHGNEILIIDEANKNNFIPKNFNFNEQKLPKCDGIITQIKNSTLIVITADCLPILITNKDKTIIAAIHSGWKSTLSSINSEVIGIIEEIGIPARDLIVAIGPAISKESFEVGQDVFDEFFNFDKSYKIFFEKKDNGKYSFDLKLLVHNEYERLGVGAIETIDIDTYSDEKFYSYRAKTHGKIEKTGLQGSFICL